MELERLSGTLRAQGLQQFADRFAVGQFAHLAIGPLNQFNGAFGSVTADDQPPGNADQIGIRDETELKALLARYRETVRHIFFGHCHFSLSGTVTGIPFSAPRSTNHPCWPDFSGNPLRMGHGALQPNYNVCFLGADDVIVHAIDFLDADKVRWEETTEEGWIPEGPDTEPRVPTR